MLKYNTQGETLHFILTFQIMSTQSLITKLYIFQALVAYLLLYIVCCILYSLLLNLEYML